MSNFRICAGDLVKLRTSDPDIIYLVIKYNGTYYAVSEFAPRKLYSTDIMEIRRYEVDYAQVDEYIWANAKKIWKRKQDYTFVGISFSADVQDYYSMELPESPATTLYDNMLTLEENNQKIREAKQYVMIPPKTFNEDHIIGEGLYQQYLVRTKAGKPSYVYTRELGLKEIRTTYKLQDPRKTHSALVVLK